jgi:hypothetical protein
VQALVPKCLRVRTVHFHPFAYFKVVFYTRNRLDDGGVFVFHVQAEQFHAQGATLFEGGVPLAVLKNS